ncbi:unnamed protein product [Calicophoron daubneyi]
MGQKNHEVVPVELAQKISRCRRGGSSFVKLMKDQLVSTGLIAYESDSKKSMHGYRLTNLGYDYLALHQLFKSQQLADLGSMIGAGKESDVYAGIAGPLCGRPLNEAEPEPSLLAGIPELGTPVVVKFHRLGRTSFRKVREKREYHQHRNTCSWLYLDRLASQREYLMMKALYVHGIAVPVPLAQNRNAVVMSYIEDAVPLSRVLPSVLRESGGSVARRLYTQAVSMLREIASIGLVHGDFNEFNLMVAGLQNRDQNADPGSIDVKLTLIDFPQMISRDHVSAESIYSRDVNGVVSFFARFLDIPEECLPPGSLDDIRRTAHVDVEVKAPGYQTKRNQSHQQDRWRDMLLGSTAVAQSSSDEISTDEEQIKDDGLDKSYSGSDSSCSDAESADQTSEECSGSDVPPVINKNGPVRKKTVKSMSDSYKASDGLISQEQIRARRRREQRQQEQINFQRRVKRHTRAQIKRHDRASIKGELTLFS